MPSKRLQVERKSRAVLSGTRRPPAKAKQEPIAPLPAPELQQWQKLLATAKQTFEAQDAHPIPFLLVTRRGLILHWNKAAADLLGLERSWEQARSLSQFVLSSDQGRCFKLLARCEANQSECKEDLLLQTPGGSPKRVRLIMHASQTADAIDPVLFRVAVLDLSDDESSAQELGHKNWNAIVEAIDAIVWDADAPMRFRFVSPQAQRLLGYPLQQWTKEPDFWESHIYHEDRERALQKREWALRKKQPHMLEYRLIAADRRIVYVRDSAVPLTLPNGTVKLVGIISDISELQNAREHLRHYQQQLEFEVKNRTDNLQQSLKAMETFCYGIAHDLSGPLRTIQGFTALLVSDYSQGFDETGHDYAERIRGAVDHLSNLIQALLVYGRLSSTAPTFVPVNLKELLRRVVTAFEADLSKAHAKLQLQMDYPRVYANPPLVEQVMANLISNAIKFRRRNVRPEISVHSTVVHQERKRGNDFLRITISDNGIGIEPGQEDRIFGVFQKLHKPSEYPGTGMGLAIVKRAVELMNGQVGVYSHPGQGSSFWVSLPVSSEATQPDLL